VLPISLTRSTRKLALTDAGAAYLARCKRILDDVVEAELEAANEYETPRGELVLTAPIVFGRLHVVPVVNEFLGQYPEINARMVLSDRTADLVDERIDVAVRVGSLPDSNMVAVRVGDVRRVVCGSPAYFAARGIPKIPEDLTDLTCVTFSGMGTGASWTFRGSSRSQPRAYRPRCRLNINTAESAIDAAVAGVGVTHVLSYQVAHPVAEGKLRVVLEDYEPEPTPVSLVHAGQGLVPLKVRRFMEYAAPRLRQRLNEDK
jgi:DNA-binding transcriptional LysR family regulator